MTAAQTALDSVFASLGPDERPSDVIIPGPPAKEERPPQAKPALPRRIAEVNWEDSSWYKDLIPDRYGPHTIMKACRQIYERAMGEKARL